MALGKREQIVMGGIAALGTIFVLHLFVFAPNAASFKTAKASYEGAVQQVQAQKIIRNPAELTSFTQGTDRLVQDLNQGIRQLRMEQPEAFIPVTAESVTVPAGTPPDQVETLRTSMMDTRKAEAKTSQTSMTLGQISRLQTIAVGDPKFSFLGPQGWALPTELPPAMQTAQLWDTLTQIAQSKDTMAQLTQGTSAYSNLRSRYQTLLGQIGLNVQTAQKLKQYGEFVPLFYRLSVANLIIKQMPADRPIIILQEILTHERIFELLEVELPFDNKPGMPDGLLYIVYSQLENLNQLLEQAREYQTQDVTRIELPAYGYLRQQDSLPDADKGVVDPAQLPKDDVIQRGDPTQVAGMTAAAGGATPGGMMLPPMGGLPGAPGGPGGEMAPGGAPGMLPGGGPGMAPMPGGMMMPGMMGGPMGLGGAAGTAATKDPAEANKPGENEIGYAIPIKMTFRADNGRTWRFIYEVLRSQPLVELNRLLVRSLSERDPNNSNLECTVTYIFVPKLFGTLDTVRKLLQEIESGQTAPASEGMAGGPPGMMMPPVPGGPPIPSPVR